MKRVILLLAAFMVALVPAGTASAAPDVNAKKLGTGYFTVANATIPAAGGCFYHPMRADVNIGYETDGWFMAVNVTGPNGAYVDSWISELYWDDWGASYFEETIFICSTIDGPGTYTITGEISTVDNGSATVLKSPMTPATFVVNPSAPPVVTPPVVNTPAPAATADVAGNVTKKKVDHGVKLTFKTKEIPAGTVVGNKLQWSIVVDDKVKSFSMGADAVKTKILKFKKRSGVHKIKVLRNGKVAMRMAVRA